MLRQLHKISIKLTDKFNNKIKSSNYYFLGFLLLICYNYYALYNYLLDKNYNLILFYFVYLFLLYNFFNIFSYFILFITISIFQLLNIDNYIKNSSIIENHESITVRNYRIQRRQQERQQRRQQRQNRRRNANYQRGAGGPRGDDDDDDEETLEARITASANARGQRAENEGRAVTSEQPPDPAYQYITTHLPDCGRAALALQSVPQAPSNQ
jgi:hypothetical protein